MSVYITGDTHGNRHDYIKLIVPMESMKPSDYLIIAGDFGGLWESDTDGYGVPVPLEKELEWIRKKYLETGPTVLWVDGNHENFDVIENLPVTQFLGGKAQRVTKNVWHLMRGEVYTIEGKTWLAMGGAASIDKMWRYPHVSWWPQELITEDDVINAKKNLAKYDNKVDYVVSHTCPNSLFEDLRQAAEVYSEYRLNTKFEDISTKYLDEVKDVVSFNKWYFGHYHFDAEVTDKFTCLYREVEMVY